MATYQNYIVAQSLEEAWALNQKRSAVIVAGPRWLRMCGLRKQTAIDLSALGLDRIEETEEAFVIGAMTTLRQLETDAALGSAFGGAFAHALAPIVGTQFRNGATIGGSVYSRFGFSDVSALLLALDASVELVQRGRVPLWQYQQEAWDRDVIAHIRVPKGRRAHVESVRLNATDFPVLVCTASSGEGGLRLVMGARPARAMVVADGLPESAGMETFEALAQSLPLGSNMRGSEAYRRKIAPALMLRAAEGARGRD